MNTQWGNASGIRALEAKYTHKIAGPEAIATRVPAMSCPQKFIDMDYGINFVELATGFACFKNQLGSVVTYWVQRNLSPTASLQTYANGF